MNLSNSNVENSNDLDVLSYRELQTMAMSLNIPANLKRSTLITMVSLNRSGKYDSADRLLNDYRKQRKRLLPSFKQKMSRTKNDEVELPPFSKSLWKYQKVNDTALQRNAIRKPKRGSLPQLTPMASELLPMPGPNQESIYNKTMPTLKPAILHHQPQQPFGPLVRTTSAEQVVPRSAMVTSRNNERIEPILSLYNGPVRKYVPYDTCNYPAYSDPSNQSTPPPMIHMPPFTSSLHPPSTSLFYPQQTIAPPTSPPPLTPLLPSSTPFLYPSNVVREQMKHSKYIPIPHYGSDYNGNEINNEAYSNETINCNYALNRRYSHDFNSEHNIETGRVLDCKVTYNPQGLYHNGHSQQDFYNGNQQVIQQDVHDGCEQYDNSSGYNEQFTVQESQNILSNSSAGTAVSVQDNIRPRILQQEELLFEVNCNIPNFTCMNSFAKKALISSGTAKTKVREIVSVLESSIATHTQDVNINSQPRLDCVINEDLNILQNYDNINVNNSVVANNFSDCLIAENSTSIPVTTVCNYRSAEITQVQAENSFNFISAINEILEDVDNHEKFQPIPSTVVCRYDNYGCPYYTQSVEELMKHEKHCIYQQTYCPVDSCTWNSSLHNFHSHITEVNSTQAESLLQIQHHTRCCCPACGTWHNSNFSS